MDRPAVLILGSDVQLGIPLHLINTEPIQFCVNHLKGALIKNGPVVF